MFLNTLGSGDEIESRPDQPTTSDIYGENMRDEDIQPNFIVKYVNQSERDISTFMDKWILHSSVSINFKMIELVNQPIGSKIVKRRKNRSASSEEPTNTINNHNSQGNNDAISTPNSQVDGLPLRLDIDNKKHIVTKLYASFDDELTVYVIDDAQSLIQIRDNLNEFLEQTYASSIARTETQRQRNFKPVKLYTQNIVMTYKVLTCGFNLDELTLNRHFEWHAFDVAWWLINNCPNRGFNNCRSSLSLVSKTSWIPQYRHFLYPDLKKSTPTTTRRSKDFNKMKDIVKAGKTAILKPLITEILEELKNRNQVSVYSSVEIPSRLTMAQLMVHGIGLDMKCMKDELNLYEDLRDQLNDIAQKYYAKSSISLTSIKQVARVLYEDLDLKKHLLDHGTISDISRDPTNSEILTILSKYHPFPKIVQNFRKISKALEALQSVNTHARLNTDLNMMRVFGHCDFWQLTGRVAMSDPDLFLINRNFKIVIPAHGNREEESVECVPRRCFVPMKNWIFVAADYSQLELRLLAHFSEDPNLLEILNRSADVDADEGFDVFKTVASKINQLPLEEISDENRQHAKQICYGIIYGMGNTSLANQLGVEMDKADDFRRDFFAAFPRIQTYTDELLEECRELGFVQSILGRRRPVEGLKSSQSTTRSRSERVAINTRIQSSASDIIKLAMQEMHHKIIANYENSARLVLEMHDELIYEVNPAIQGQFSTILKHTMENLTLMQNLRVKLVVNLKSGNSWAHLKTFTPESFTRNRNCDFK